jgi:uncharacterized protein YjeT (DUF2065 family)
MVNWHDLFVAFALLFVIEGILPFLNPAGLRRTMLMLSQLSDQQLRTAGVASMLVGVLMLYVINR